MSGGPERGSDRTGSPFFTSVLRALLRRLPPELRDGYGDAVLETFHDA